MESNAIPKGTDDFECFRPYLAVLARQGLRAMLSGKFDESDIVQDTLLRAHRARGKVEGKPQGELLAWLRTILANRLIDLHRRFGSQRRSIERERSLDAILDESSYRLGENLPGDDSSPSGKAARNEAMVSVAAALERLSPTQRDAIELKYLNDLSFSEVADTMGLSRDQVAGLIRRGLEKLRMQMRADDVG